ncbi:MAG: PQQ-dependent sugar dehydrogenase [Bacteroidota bacterium]|nr:PQQ-dependent sugar dehydrogenase [Bacteroidota bacterium]
MRPFQFITLLSAILLITACGNQIRKPATTTDNTPDDNTTGTIQSVETEAANTNYPPAFEGQTRIIAISINAPYQADVLSSKLDKPWGIAVLPDGRFLITEKKGSMRIASSNGMIGDEIKGIPSVNSSGQGGLLGLCIDPAFEQNRMVYWVFSEELPDGNVTAVAKGKLSADEKTIQNATVLYRATPAYKGNLHYGGRILYSKEGHLYISTGERSDLETRPLAQDLNAGLGKIIRITMDGKPVAGNPFTETANASPAVYTYGHRNVQGIAFHPVTGDLWENEFGPRGGDEVNIIRPGKNYGWPIITYGIEYQGGKIGDAIQQKDGMEQPVYYWDPVISPSGMTFYNSDVMPEWKHNLFLACLSGQHICRLVIKDNKVIGEERLLADEGQRFRDITQGMDGALYAITDQGRFYKISKKG